MMELSDTQKDVLLFLFNRGNQSDGEGRIEEQIADVLDMSNQAVGTALSELRRFGYILKKPKTGIVETGLHSGEGLDPENFEWVPTGKAHRVLSGYRDELLEQLQRVVSAEEDGFVYRPEQCKDQITKVGG